MLLALVIGAAASAEGKASRPDLKELFDRQVKAADQEPLDPKRILSKETKDARYYEVSYVGAAGTRIFGTMVEPAGIEGVPGVLIIHDFGESRLDDLAKDFARAGFLALAIDLRGHGRTAGDREVILRHWMSEFVDEPEHLAVLSSAVDVARGIRFMKQQTGSVFLAGIGLGANLAWIAASREKVRAVAVAGPVFCKESVDPILKDEPSPSGAVQSLSTSGMDAVQWVATFLDPGGYNLGVPSMIAQAVTDRITPKACVQRWIRRIPRTTWIDTVTFAHRGLFVSSEWTRSMVKWFEQVLAGGRPSKKGKL